MSNKKVKDEKQTEKYNNKNKIEKVKMENEENVIEIRNLVKEYKMFRSKKDRLVETIFPGTKKHDVFRAMDNLNLNLKKGEVLGILGKNGAGKSTLLKMITGVVTPTSGELRVNGKISSLLELGTAFNLELTGMENIYQHGQVMGLTNEEIEERKQDIIDFADIGEHLAQPVKTYSSGMFARLAFACAINVDPDILIVDEVLSVGDMAFQLKCFKKFEQFKEQGKTIIFVTHSITDVIRNCTRSIIIESGKKTFDGSVKDGVERYKKIIVKLDKAENVIKDDMAEIEKELQQDKEKNKDNKLEEKSKTKHNNSKEDWKSHFDVNPDIIEYGNGKADLIDYGIFDENGDITTGIENGKEVILKSKVIFNEDTKDPIFTMTIKDFKGLDMMGTNTVIEKIITGEFKKGEIAIAEFKQKISLAPNKYTISFSCTKFTPSGELEVLSRKYDALLVEVISTKECVGLYRLDSDIKIIKEKSN